MKVIFIISVAFVIHFGFTECMVKYKSMDNLEKTFLELNKRCLQITGVRKEEYLRQLATELKNEIVSTKGSVTKLREEYQARLDISDKHHRMYLEGQSVIQDLEQRLTESEQANAELQHLYLLKEKEVTELNIDINRLKTVLEKFEKLNDSQSATIENKNKLIKQLQVEMEVSSTKILGLEREIKILIELERGFDMEQSWKFIQREVNRTIDWMHQEFMSDMEDVKNNISSYLTIRIAAMEEEKISEIIEWRQRSEKLWEERINVMISETQKEISKLSKEVRTYEESERRRKEEINILQIKHTSCENTLVVCQKNKSKSTVIEVIVSFGSQLNVTGLWNMMRLYASCMDSLGNRNFLEIDVNPEELDDMNKRIKAFESTDAAHINVDEKDRHSNLESQAMPHQDDMGPTRL